MANAPIVVAEGDEDIELDYDSDGYPIIPDRAKVGPRLRPPRSHLSDVLYVHTGGRPSPSSGPL